MQGFGKWEGKFEYIFKEKAVNIHFTENQQNMFLKDFLYAVSGGKNEELTPIYLH